ncbi:hypothetical protein ACFLUF_02860 [Chloroflexota bacterium]
MPDIKCLKDNKSADFTAIGCVGKIILTTIFAILVIAVALRMIGVWK